jgi:hypothetical protein
MQVRAVPYTLLVVALLLATAWQTTGLPTSSKDEPLQLQQQRRQTSFSNAMQLMDVHDQHHGPNEHVWAAALQSSSERALTCTHTPLENQQTYVELGPDAVVQAQHPLAVPFSSGAAARRLQQAGTTLQPNSAPTRCLDTLGNYTNYARLNLAVSCTGSVNQQLGLPAPGLDLSMKLLGGTNKCLDVAFSGTASGTAVGVSGVTCYGAKSLCAATCRRHRVGMLCSR